MLKSKCTTSLNFTIVANQHLLSSSSFYIFVYEIEIYNLRKFSIVFHVHVHRDQSKAKEKSSLKVAVSSVSVPVASDLLPLMIVVNGSAP